jgi:hypothetical protein
MDGKWRYGWKAADGLEGWQRTNFEQQEGEESKGAADKELGAEFGLKSFELSSEDGSPKESTNAAQGSSESAGDDHEHHQDAVLQPLWMMAGA